MINDNYISYIKELILHHCLRCQILSETPYCEYCKAEIEGKSVMVKVEIKISGSAVDAEIAGLGGDFQELTNVALRWKPTEFNIGSLYRSTFRDGMIGDSRKERG